MAATLRSQFPTDRLRVIVADFEVVDIEAGQGDAVFFASAYHWISPAAQTDRPAAFLRPGGVVAIVELIQVDSYEDAGFFAAAEPIYERYGQGHSGPPAPTRESVVPTIRAVLRVDSRFDCVEVRQYNWDQTYSALNCRNLMLSMLSYSGTQMMQESTRVGLLDDMASLIRDEFGVP